MCKQERKDPAGNRIWDALDHNRTYMIILDMYLTMLSVILGGILNMLFVKTNFYKKYKYPIDCNRKFRDGKRIFGDNKTWIGIVSMIVCCILSQVFIGFICNAFNINNHNQIYRFYENKVGVNVLTGFLFGFMYMLFELPNSFIKRRLDIECGKTNTNIIGKLFFVIDQIDSLIGVMLILVIFAKISWKQYFAYISIGDRIQDIERLVVALSDIQRLYARDPEQMPNTEYINPTVMVSPQTAFYAEKKAVPIRETEGMICGEFAMCYPPGIPILAPGEMITKEIIDYIIYAKEKGCSMQGMQDTEIEYLYVLSEK